MSRIVQVVPYDMHWPALFEEEARQLRVLFGPELISIHHFGSTSIPGTSAKPIIDILVVVHFIDLVDPLNPGLQQMGYIAVGEYGIAGRRFFYKGTNELRSHHLHVYQAGNAHILRHLAFRDYMRAHPLAARAYSQLKEALALEFPQDMEAYINGKSEFVQKQERRALDWYSRDKNRTPAGGR